MQDNIEGNLVEPNWKEIIAMSYNLRPRKKKKTQDCWNSDSVSEDEGKLFKKK